MVALFTKSQQWVQLIQIVITIIELSSNSNKIELKTEGF